MIRIEHVQGDVAHRPLPRRGRAVEILVADTGERTGQVAVRVVILAEDPLRLIRSHATECRKPDRKVAELVLGHK